jgi:ATP-dependent Lon protease
LSEVLLEKEQNLTTLPVLPLRDVVVFPNMVIPLFVGREKSIVALDTAMNAGKEILLVAQKKADIDEPSIKDLHEIGTLSKILQLLKLPDGTVKVLVEGSKRIKVLNLKFDECFTADYINLENNDSDDREIDILSRALVSQFEQYLKLNKKIPPEVLTSISGIDNACKLSDTITAHIPLKLNEKQKILEISNVKKRLEHLLEVIQGEIDVLQVEKQVRIRVKSQMEKSQREYYLNEQMKAIQSELGDIDNTSNDLADLETKITNSGMTKDASTKAVSELKKLKMMSPMSAEATVVRNYLDCLLNVPWKKKNKIIRNIVKAEDILNEDHYGLDKVKERILEYLAVQQRVKKLKGPILCLVGPPGVGKTSLGKSIARATNRKFVRMSLGGVRDEAEIRGHRRTYIGSMPGKIIQNLSKVKTKNPLFLLDEIDKMAMDFRGDPSSALLEVLDPEQNHTFADHYLEVDYDLSDVMFVCTANSLDIPSPLLDRMEVIRISGYTEDEKLNIARKYLLPKQFRANGLKSNELSINVSAVTDIIQKYTREAGVRSLERAISKVCRKTVKYLLSGANKKFVKVTSRNLKQYLGVSQYSHKIADNKDQIGQVNGLAWTQVGGEILTIETAVVPGKGKLTHTGKLGSVMTESIQAAMTVVRSRSTMFNLKEDFHKIYDFHVHVPEGATPKDGPSAGVGMCTALVSALTDIPVRCDIAMTGEITLRGEVLAIGGLKEKLLAAHRGGIKTVLIPHENEKDLEEIPNNIKGKLEILPVKWIDEVLEKALVHSPISIPQKDAEKTKKSSLESIQNREDTIRPH